MEMECANGISMQAVNITYRKSSRSYSRLWSYSYTRTKDVSAKLTSLLVRSCQVLNLNLSVTGCSSKFRSAYASLRAINIVICT